MSKLLSSLGMTLFNWQNWLQSLDTSGKAKSYEWIATLYAYLTPILYGIMAVVAAAGSIYAIVLGVNLARAEDTSKRDEAKKHLITVLIAVAVTVGLVLFFNEILPYILTGFLGGNETGTK